jgi:predicted nucleic acid-binding protein
VTTRYRYYVDTSAAVKLLRQEAETEALRSWMSEADGELVSSLLLETELRRVAHRHAYPQMKATEILDGIALYEIPAVSFRRAGNVGPRDLRSLDALHLVGLQRTADAMVTYDDRLAEAARADGFEVVSPGLG